MVSRRFLHFLSTHFLRWNDCHQLGARTIRTTTSYTMLVILSYALIIANIILATSCSCLPPIDDGKISNAKNHHLFSCRATAQP